MPDIKLILEKNKDNITQLINDLSADASKARNAIEYKAEYDGERTRRRTSVGMREDKRLKVYSDTLKDKNGDPARLEDKIVHVAKIVTNFPRKLVRTDAAMMFGGTMNVSADNQDDGLVEFKRVWERVLGMQDVLISFSKKVLSETRAAIIFYPTQFEHWSGKTSTEINCKILSLPKDTNTRNDFYPHFHDGKMDAFLHYYDLKDENGRITEEAKIWTRNKILTFSRASGESWVTKEQDNLFNLIPVVYAEVEEPAWEESVSTMDAREMRLSRLADTNDYFAEPTIVSYGETMLPGKSTVGKEIQYPIAVDPDTGRPMHGDAKILAWDQSIDSTAKELDEIKHEMLSGVSMPDLSFDSLKGIGNLSGVARRFMMMDAEIKRMFNMRTFRPALNRCITIVQAGIANISNVKYRNLLVDNRITVTFESILPKDPVEDANILSIANGGKAFNSQSTVVSRSPLTPPGDVEAELERMREDARLESENSNMIGANAF